MDRRWTGASTVAILALMPETNSRGPFAVLAAVLAAVCAFVVAAEVRSARSMGVLFIAGWNCMPPLLALGLAATTRSAPLGPRFAAYGFAVGAAGLVLLGHVAWAFDIAKTASGSSTSALLLLFLPPYAVVAGVVFAPVVRVIAAVATRLHRSRRTDTSPP
jgi:hypothetical protein